jgi:hypothetical protein
MRIPCRSVSPLILFYDIVNDKHWQMTKYIVSKFFINILYKNDSQKVHP